MKKVKSHPDAVDYFKKLPFYKKHIAKPKIKHLKNIDLLSKLPFYEEMNVVKKIMHLEDMQWITKLKQLRKNIQWNSYKQVNQLLKTWFKIF